MYKEIRPFTNQRLNRLLFKILLRVKLSIIAILLFVFEVQATSFAQRVTLSAQSVPLSTVLKHLHEQTGYDFLYNFDVLERAAHVSVNFKNAPLKEVLDKCLLPQSLSYTVDKTTILIEPSKTRSVDKADERITGTVSDEKGEPLIGVTVRVKGGSGGVVTDAKGKYAITVPGPDAILTFTYLGFVSQEVAVNGRSVVNVSLKESTRSLEEVVVIGYGTQQKKNLTGSVSTVGGKELAAVPVPSISNTIAGRLTGVTGMNSSGEPGVDDANILIRGLSTTGNSAPLIVVDGVANREGGFSRIDPNDIESVTVLKDASAAIYGARAGNGVILVTTKRGKTGKPALNYTFNYGLRQATRLPDMLDAPTYARAINELNTSSGQQATYTDEDIQKFSDGSSPLTHPNTDWFKETLQPVAGQYQQNVSANGGNENVKFFISIGNQFQDGYYKNGATNYRQYNVRSNLDAQITKSFKVFLNLSGRQENRNYPHHGSETIFRYLVAAKPMALAFIPGTDLPAMPLGDDVNPVAAATSIAGYQRDRRLILNGDLGFTLDMPYITKGLSLIGGAYLDRYNNTYSNFFKNFQLYSISNGNPLANSYGPRTAELGQRSYQNVGITSNLRLNYERNFENTHDIGAFVAFENYSSRYDNLTANRTNFISSEIEQLFGGEINNQLRNNGDAFETARQNYFGRLSYGYKGKYLFQFNWRYDGSSNFPSDKRYGFFPGVSAGWRLSEESFMKGIPFLNNLKIRGSWGQLGNDQVPNFQYYTLYTITNGGVFGGNTPAMSQAINVSQVPNPNITWEVVNTTNAGIDASLFRSRLDVTLDVFYTKRNNILARRNASISDYLGLTLPDENIGKVENRGFEASLNYKGSIQDLKYSVGTNVSFNKNKVLFMDEAASAFPWQMRTGKPIGARLLWEATGIFRSQEQVDQTPHAPGTKPGDLIFRDVDGDGEINGNDRVMQDITGVPRFTFGVPVSFNYKGWNLNMLWQGQAKAAQYVYFQSGRIGNFTQEYWDNHWSPENPNASGPRLYDRESIPSTSFLNTYFFRSADFIRLKSLQIGYTLPKKVFGKLPVSNIQVYASGFNLLTFDKLKYLDPEANANSQNYAGWYTPQTRVFNFGVNVNF